MRGFLENFGLYLVFLAILMRFRSPRDRERRRTVLESAAAEWSRWFPLQDEASHYAGALRGKTVAVHIEPYGHEKILRWDELRSMAPPFVSETQGRLTRAGYAGAQGFRALAWGGMGLAAADIAWFVRNPDFMWHGLCLCEFSLALLALGCLLLLPASKLRFRMRYLPHAICAGQFEGASRSILIFLIAAAGEVWAGVLFSSGLSSNSPDWVFFAVASAPVFPLFWWSSVVGTAAVRELRPIGHFRSWNVRRVPETMATRLAVGEQTTNARSGLGEAGSRQVSVGKLASSAPEGMA